MYPTITPKGLTMIKQWVEQHSAIDQFGALHTTDPRNLDAWATEAEEAVSNGNPPMVEMQSWATRSGHTETLTLPSDCVEWVDTD